MTSTTPHIAAYNRFPTTRPKSTSLTHYKFRAECRPDVCKLIEKYGYVFEDITISTARLATGGIIPDVDVTFTSEATIEEIRAFMADVEEDAHVMIESLNYANVYTGERWFTD
jgi:hypothetical protein